MITDFFSTFAKEGGRVGSGVAAGASYIPCSSVALGAENVA